MSVEKFITKPGVQNIPEGLRPTFARIAGEVIGYNREVMEIYGDGPSNTSVIEKIELKDLGPEKGNIIEATSVGGVAGAGNKTMLEGCVEDLEMDGIRFGYDLNVEGTTLGVFDFTHITQKHAKFVDLDAT